MGRKAKCAISIADDDVHSILSENDNKSTKSESSKSSENENKIITTKDFTSRETYYYKSIDKYFKSQSIDMISQMIDIIEKDSDISLRILDWFVTRYSNKFDISYKLDSKDDDEFNVHISYKAQLKSYKKKYFDPFRRRTKFNYKYEKDGKSKEILTTIGQLNFFRWAFSNKVIEYVEKNHKIISKAMNKSNKEDKKRKNDRKLKPKEIVEKDIEIEDKTVKVIAKKKINNKNVEIVLTFD